ncbi:MAG: sodium:solute symporter family protein [candidate division Zixibacteria bacterium]|nr:sodium:solute symporter family protein [candidate division Zixibacteria bacterium]
MHIVDYGIVIAYLVVLLFLGLVSRLRRGSSASDMIVGGRVLTLPAFVASLVSTWYGGILGVGEYSYNYGLSNWLVFGVPYYLAALLFALFLAKRARESQLLTIPDQLARTYDSKTALAGAVVIYVMTVPAAYVLMLGVLCQYLFGWPMWVGVSAGTLFSIVYVFSGGFKSVVRTDLFQFVLMFTGFTVLLVALNIGYGGIDFVMDRVPETHLTWHGGNSGWYVAVWYVIALATLIEPAFYQRCYAARTSSVARRGIFISIICWTVFDFLTTSCGLYARAILPDLADPVAAYPALALHVLPAGLMGLFALALLSTVMSTVDSYSFLAASTFGNDIAPRIARIPESMIIPLTRFGLVISTLLAVALALFFRSVVDIWHALGSIGTPALLVPVFFSFVGKWRLPGHAAFISIVTSALISGIWYFSRYFSSEGNYWFDIEPIFPGLLWSIILFVLLHVTYGRRFHPRTG